MNRNIEFTYRGRKGSIGEMTIMHMLPNSRMQSVGPFVIADLMRRMHFKARPPKMPDGHGAHPHRGIATFTYLLHGEIEHFDSRGHHGIVADGGGQWMNAGNGIIHDENFSQAFQKSGGPLLGVQFWINLPAKEKGGAPDYMAVQDADLPKIELTGGAGIFKIVVGSYEGQTSRIKTFSRQFLYHIRLMPGKTFTMRTQHGLEYAVLLAGGSATINGSDLKEADFAVFGQEGDSISCSNNGDATADILIFGGEPYSEPIAAHGPFVMNTETEIMEAYADYRVGKYGKVDHSKAQPA